MTVSIVDTGVRTAFAAATTQQAQCEAVVAPWAGGNVVARVLGSGGALRQTVTLGPWTISTTTPREVRHGARLAFTTVSTGDIASVEYRTSGGALIFTASAGEGATAAALDFAGPIRNLCGITLSGAAFTANPALSNFSIRTVELDGITTPGSMHAAWVKNGALYTGWVDSVGHSGVTKYNRLTDTRQRQILSSSTNYDSHNSCALEWTADNRLIAAWAKHYDSTVRCRRALVAESVTGGFAAETNRTQPGNTHGYAHLFRLSQNNSLYLWTRLTASNSASPRSVTSSTDDGATWSPFRTWVRDPLGERPYPIFLSDGVSRVYVAFNGTSVTGAAPLCTGYMQLDGSNVERFYLMNGTEITGGGFSKTDATIAFSANKTWPYDLAFGPDGEIWMTWFRFPTSSDHRIMFQKTTGGRTSWLPPVELTPTGGTLYALEPFSHAGAVFDAEDPTTIWLCRKTPPGKHEVYKWRTVNNGASWSEVEQITSGSAFENFQIISPREHGGDFPAVWSHGTYTYWDSGYNTEFRALVRD